MTPQEVINRVKELYSQILQSDNDGILRDFDDDPFEPVCIDILGIMYEFHDAEVIGTHPYYEGQSEEDYCDIKLQCRREDDYGSDGESKIYEFVVSIEWLKGHMERLYWYLHTYDGEDNKPKPVQNPEGLYPLAVEYFKKARAHIDNGSLYAAYTDIAYTLDTSEGDVQQVITLLKNRIYHGDKAKFALELFQKDQEEEHV